MPEATPNNTAIYLLVGIVVAFLLVILVFGLVTFFNEFIPELKYLNAEINRTQGNERKYWIRKRRKLWLSLLPFVKY